MTTKFQLWLESIEDSISSNLKEEMINHVNGLEVAKYNYYGYGLMLGEEPTSIHAVANSEEHFTEPQNSELYTYKRYSVDEWEHWDNGLFNKTSAVLEKHFEYVEQTFIENDDSTEPTESIFHQYTTFIHNIVLNVFEALTKSPPLSNLSNSFFVIWISDSFSNIMLRSAKQLNSKDCFEEFKREFG